MADKYVAKIDVWGHNMTPEVQTGRREQFVTLPAQSMRQAVDLADLIVEAIRTNPYVWTCKVAEIRECGFNEHQRLVSGDSEAVYAHERETIAKAEQGAFQRGKSQAETAAIHVEDRLKLEIERLTYAMQALLPNSSETEESLREAWQAHRRLQIEQFEAV